jgi:hypothetical protein
MCDYRNGKATLVALMLAAALHLLLATVSESEAAHASETAGGIKPDFMLTVDGPAHTCHVARAGDSSASTIPCAKVTAYLIETLKLVPGSYFDYSTIADVDEQEFDRTLRALKDAGYRPTPGIHVGFLTEPKPDPQ